MIGSTCEARLAGIQDSATAITIRSEEATAKVAGSPYSRNGLACPSALPSEPVLKSYWYLSTIQFHPAEACRPRSGRERHADVDRRAGPKLRFDRQFAIDQLQPLLHAREAKPAAFYSLNWIKPNTRIMHNQKYLIRSTAE